MFLPLKVPKYKIFTHAFPNDDIVLLHLKVDFGVVSQMRLWLFGFRELNYKGTGYSEKFGKVTKDLWGTGTSRCSNGLKSGPQPPCQLRLMKI